MHVQEMFMSILHKPAPAHTPQTKHVEVRQTLTKIWSVYVESNKNSPSCLSVLHLCPTPVLHRLKKPQMSESSVCCKTWFPLGLLTIFLHNLVLYLKTILSSDFQYMCMHLIFLMLFSLWVYVHAHGSVCVHDKVPGNELIGHMSAQMSSLFNKAGDLNCHYCQHLTVALPARWYLVIYHHDELSEITLYYTVNPSQIRNAVLQLSFRLS